MSPGEMLTVSDVDRWGIKKITKKNRNKEIRVKASLLVFTTREYFPREIIFKLYYAKRMGFSGGSAVKNLPVVQEMQEMWSWSLNREDLLEEGMATHSSTLVWRIPCIAEPGGLQSMGSQRVRHAWSNWACMHMQSKFVEKHWNFCFLECGLNDSRLSKEMGVKIKNIYVKLLKT